MQGEEGECKPVDAEDYAAGMDNLVRLSAIDHDCQPSLTTIAALRYGEHAKAN